MSTLSKKEIQQAVTTDDLTIIPMDKPQKKNNQTFQGNYGFRNNRWYSNKFNFGILSYNVIRFVIVIITSISLMELERAL